MKKTLTIILIALVSILNAQVIPNSSIKWGVNLDSNALDFKGNCNGTINGCTFTGSNTGVSFNGTTDYIEFSLTSFTLGGFYFSEYFNFSTNSTDTMYLFGNSNAAKTPSTQSLYAKIGNGILTVGFWQNLGIVYKELSTPMALNDGSVHSVVFQRKDAYRFNLYIDGNSTAVSTLNTYPQIYTPNKQNSHFTIGRYGDYTGYKPFTGTINKLFIFFGLNQSQIDYIGSSQTNPKGAPF
jgi:hypothetical protein